MCAFSLSLLLLFLFFCFLLISSPISPPLFFFSIFLWQVLISFPTLSLSLSLSLSPHFYFVVLETVPVGFFEIGSASDGIRTCHFDSIERSDTFTHRHAQTQTHSLAHKEGEREIEGGGGGGGGGGEETWPVENDTGNPTFRDGNFVGRVVRRLRSVTMLQGGWTGLRLQSFRVTGPLIPRKTPRSSWPHKWIHRWIDNGKEDYRTPDAYRHGNGCRLPSRFSESIGQFPTSIPENPPPPSPSLLIPPHSMLAIFPISDYVLFTAPIHRLDIWIHLLTLGDPSKPFRQY